MKKTNILFFGMIILALSLISLVSAQEVIINMKSSFSQGQYTSFTYTFVGFNGEVEYYAGVRCDELPVGFFVQKTNVSGNLTLQYPGFQVDRQLENCYAYVNVLSPAELSAIQPFIIENANLEFEFNVKACKEPSCTEKSNVFLKNENIYLDYDSSVESPLINAVLTYPDGSTSRINLPGSIRAGISGTYTLEATASKQGYNPVTKELQLGVIEKNADIKHVNLSACKTDGVCTAQEAEANCPRDCNKKEQLKSSNPNSSLIMMLMVFMLLIVITIAWMNRGKEEW